MPFFVQKLEQGIDDLNRALRNDVFIPLRWKCYTGMGKYTRKKQ